MTTEIEETESFLSTATYPGVKLVLQNHLNKLRKEEDNKALAAAKAAKAAAESEVASTSIATKKPLSSTSNILYTPLENFDWDQGPYNSPLITIYIDLEGVGTVKDGVSVNFTKSSFDVKVLNLNGKNYRLFKENLEKDIIPGDSKFIVKRDKVVLKLQKKKGEYSFEQWSFLTAKKGREESDASKKDPAGGIMDMMKNMYDEGDENMKKIIGEAMLKSRNGEKMSSPSLPTMGDDAF